MIWYNIIFRDIKNIYQINTKGIVRNKYTGKIIKPFIDKDGYYQIKLARYDKKCPIHVHILVAYTFLEYNKNLQNPQVNHKDGNKLNNHVYNLEIIEFIDNIKHAVDNNLYEKLENRYNASLSNNDVHVICKMLENGICFKDIRNNFKGRLSNDVLKKIKSGDNYKDISKHYNLMNATPFKYSDRIRKSVHDLLCIGIRNVNDIIYILDLEKNKSIINLIKNQRKRVKEGSTTIERTFTIKIVDGS